MRLVNNDIINWINRKSRFHKHKGHHAKRSTYTHTLLHIHFCSVLKAYNKFSDIPNNVEKQLISIYSKRNVLLSAAGWYVQNDETGRKRLSMCKCSFNYIREKHFLLLINYLLINFIFWLSFSLWLKDTVNDTCMC